MSEVKRTVLLHYYIPDTSTLANPAHRLHPVAVTTDGSVWIINESDIPEDLICDFESHESEGVYYSIVRFDLDEADKIREIARRAIQKRDVAAHTSLIRSLDSASEAFNAALADVESRPELSEEERGVVMKAADRRRRARVRSALRSAAKKLNDAVEAAERFDLTMDMKDCLEARKLAVAARKQAFELSLQASSD